MLSMPSWVGMLGIAGFWALTVVIWSAAAHVHPVPSRLEPWYCVIS
jgi:hypothetical protein